MSQSPWFGLGFEPYREALNLDHSVDALWLVLAIQCGIPGAVLVALSMITAVSLPAHGPGVGLTAAESKLGTTLGIVIFLTFFLAFTVDLWGSTWMLSGLRSE